ncbi:hypothetical protein H9P43_003819 [Blastocladiella emersonii ATCC 22665]|nr:hypothetical protein H9P43_003819 [Blastocladiella emersonii ATCC 22665]
MEPDEPQPQPMDVDVDERLSPEPPPSPGPGDGEVDDYDVDAADGPEAFTATADPVAEVRERLGFQLDLEQYLRAKEQATIEREILRVERALHILRDLRDHDTYQITLQSYSTWFASAPAAAPDAAPAARQHGSKRSLTGSAANSPFVHPSGTPAGSPTRSPSVPPRPASSLSGKTSELGWAPAGTTSSTRRKITDTLYERNATGDFVKIVCSDCLRSNFPSLGAFVEHCRTSHGLTVPDPDRDRERAQIIETFGQVVDDYEVPASHPLRRAPTSVESSPVSAPAPAAALRKAFDPPSLPAHLLAAGTRRTASPGYASSANNSRPGSPIPHPLSRAPKAPSRVPASVTAAQASTSSRPASRVGSPLPDFAANSTPRLPSAAAAGSSRGAAAAAASSASGSAKPSPHIPQRSAAPSPAPAVAVSAAASPALGSIAAAAGSEDTSRFHLRRRIKIGNVSKSLSARERRDAKLGPETHKWMAYVDVPRDPTLDAALAASGAGTGGASSFITRVRFILHETFAPNHIVEIRQPPFHLTRYGYGDFEINLQIYFVDPAKNRTENRKFVLTLDKKCTGQQVRGFEDQFFIELAKDTDFSIRDMPAADDEDEDDEDDSASRASSALVSGLPHINHSNYDSDASSASRSRSRAASPPAASSSGLSNVKRSATTRAGSGSGFSSRATSPTSAGPDAKRRRREALRAADPVSAQWTIHVHADVESILDSAAASFPLVRTSRASAAGLDLEYAQAKSSREFLRWSAVRRKAVEWLRARHMARMCAELTFGSDSAAKRLRRANMTTKRIVVWCRERGHTPGYMAPPPVPFAPLATAPNEVAPPICCSQCGAVAGHGRTGAECPHPAALQVAAMLPPYARSTPTSRPSAAPGSSSSSSTDLTAVPFAHYDPRLAQTVQSWIWPLALPTFDAVLNPEVLSAARRGPSSFGRPGTSHSSGGASWATSSTRGPTSFAAWADAQSRPASAPQESRAMVLSADLGPLRSSSSQRHGSTGLAARQWDGTVDRPRERVLGLLGACVRALVQRVVDGATQVAAAQKGGGGAAPQAAVGGAFLVPEHVLAAVARDPMLNTWLAPLTTDVVEKARAEEEPMDTGVEGQQEDG